MNFGFFGPKMAVSWRTSAFQKKRPWNPYFYSVFWVRAFWAKVSKKGNFEKPPKKKKNLTDNWKANFWVFLLFFFGFFFFLFFFVFSFVFFVSFFVFVFFFGGFKGQVRWPEGPPHLALNPPSFFFVFLVVFFCFLFFFGGLRVRWGGPKGHLTWP